MPWRIAHMDRLHREACAPHAGCGLLKAHSRGSYTWRLFLIRKILLTALLVSGSLSFAQSVPAAEGGSYSIWAGAEVSSFNPDWGCKDGSSPFTCWGNQLEGIAVFADANRLLGPIGLEGEARWLRWHDPGIQETNYLIGPRYQVFAGRRLSANVKFLAGAGIFNKSTFKSWEGWSAFVPGATVGYRISPRLIVRGDYEYQRWPGFVGPLGAHGLTPNGFSLGVSYRVFR
jgi:hypothetical protein